MNKKYILLWFEGPLQSWGSDSKFGRRDTEIFPTKSGIYGIFLSALGASGPQKDLLQQLAEFDQTVVSYNKISYTSTDSKTKIKKWDRPPLLMDFQMVGSGYNEKDPWEKLLIPKKRNGAAAVGGGSKMTYRYYLQNAFFSVIQEVTGPLAYSIAEALQNPVYDVYLGRKNCVPSDFIYRGVFETYEEAETEAGNIAESKSLYADFKVIEGEHDGDVLTVNDIPIQFGEWKKYRDRQITIIQING